MPFQTYAIDATPILPQDYLHQKPEDIYDQFYKLTEYLLKTYQRSGKTFLFKNWEGDNVLGKVSVRRGPFHTPTRREIRAMIANLDARYRGVSDARKAAGHPPGVQVLEAIEFNSVDNARRGQPSMLKSVIPYVRSDLLSCSAYDLAYREPTKVLDKRVLGGLTFLRKYPGVAGRPLMVGEFGESQDPSQNPFASEAKERLGILVRVFAAAGVPYVFYWQVSESKNGGDQGFGIFLPNGAKTPLWYAVHGLLRAPAGPASKPAATRPLRRPSSQLHLPSPALSAAA